MIIGSHPSAGKNDGRKRGSQRKEGCDKCRLYVDLVNIFSKLSIFSGILNSIVYVMNLMEDTCIASQTILSSCRN